LTSQDDRLTTVSASFFPQNLVYVSLSLSWSVDDLMVVEMAKRCRALKSINLLGCNKVGHKSVEALAMFCQELQSICLTGTNVCSKGFESLANHKVSLHEFYIGNTNIKGRVLLRVISQSPNLSSLDCLLVET